MRDERAGDIPSSKPPEARSLQTETQWEYGARAGVWRLMRILRQYDVKATFFACAMAVENNPPLGPEIVAQGHEVCGHGHRWIEQWDMEPEAERAYIRQAVESFKRTTGQRPLGWFTKAGPSLNTREILAEEGFLYDSDGLNDDLPYYATALGKPWLVIPYTFDTNDGAYGRTVVGNATEFFQYLKDAFDLLYEEGASQPKLLNIGLHTRVSGRPGRAAAVAHFLRYARGMPGVWFARRDEIARWWWEKYPPQR
jgi:peptidoglycan/xylan/chitin deacetylase (PgdA/CDA1 family)